MTTVQRSNLLSVISWVFLFPFVYTATGKLPGLAAWGCILSRHQFAPDKESINDPAPLRARIVLRNNRRSRKPVTE